MTVNLLRALFVAFVATVGMQVGPVLGLSTAAGGALGAAFGLLMVLVDRLLHGVSLRLLSSGSFGLLMGTIFAHLLRASDILRGVRPDLQWVISLLLYVTGAYFGTMLALRSNREDFALVIPYVQFRRRAVQDAPLLLDATALVDGRVAELCGTGFVSNTLIIPRFVVERLERQAGEEAALPRTRARRALDTLQSLQRNPALTVTIREGALGVKESVEQRLLELAHLLGARLLTAHEDLSTLARLQGTTPINLHELERMMQPAMAQGDHLELALTKEGREPHQAVGFLPNGTMVVVNQARAYVGQTVPVTIGSVVQTQNGRLFFAELA